MSPPTSRREASPSKSAAHVLAGFRYQLLHSVDALMTLRPDERLLLEVSEDFTVASGMAATDYQVKGSQAANGPPAFSLQNADIRAVLLRFWSQSIADPSLDRRLVFMARGGFANEQRHLFPAGAPGLRYWSVAAIDGDTAPLRQALIDLMDGSSLGQWLVTAPSDEELRERLLRRVSWQLELKPSDALFEQVRQQAGNYYSEKGWPVSAAKNAAHLLVSLAFEVAARPNAADRVLSPNDLRTVLEEAVAPEVLAKATAAGSSQIVASEQDILISDLEPSPSIALREALVGEVLRTVRGEPLVWLHGAHGVGKSLLARLLAQKAGGRWIILDLWPVQKDGAAALGAWRELLRVLRSGDFPRGIIVDDFDGPAGERLNRLLAALVQTLGARGSRVIVTSHHQPSAVRLTENGGSPRGIVQSPYFSAADLSELVSASPAPPTEMHAAWGAMLGLTTGGGHPLLVAAKIASLRARGWPEQALIEDFAGNTSETMQLTRDEQRRKLIDELNELDQARSLEAGRLLRRIASVFDRADDGLIRLLIADSPRLESGGDALSVLKGSWLEVLPRGDFRISPLLGDITSDVPDEDCKRWRRIAAQYWLATRTLNERTLPLCFWNAFLGQHDTVLAKVCEVILSLDKERLRGVAPILSPLTAFKTDRPIYKTNNTVDVFVRLLQFDIAEALVEDDVTEGVARRILEELDGLENADIRALLTTMSATKVLTATATHVSPKVRIEFGLRMRAETDRYTALMGAEAPDRSAVVPPWYGPEFDLPDFLISTIIAHVQSSAEVLEVFQALDELPDITRNRLLDAIDASFSGLDTFINAGWATEQIESEISERALALYDQSATVAARWKRVDVEMEIVCARSVILDERLQQRDAAENVLLEAISTYGPLPQLLRQAAKVAAHAGDMARAADLMIEIEDKIDTRSPLDRALAFRDAGTYAAKSARFADAVRLFGKAYSACTSSAHSAALSVGLLVEKALALWRDHQEGEAVLIVGEALDEVSKVSFDESRQAERSHQYARAITGLFFSELLPGSDQKDPPFTFGAASSIELSSAKLVGVDLKSLADNWRVLAAVEAGLGISVGIDERSLAAQGESLDLGIEMGVRLNRFEAALRERNVARAIEVGAELTAISRLSAAAGQGRRRVPVLEMIDLQRKPIAVDERFIEVAQSLIVDVILATVLARSATTAFFSDLERAISLNFEKNDDLEALLKSAAGQTPVNAGSPRYVVLAQGIANGEEALRRHPSLRYYRDVLMLSHLAFSMGRAANAAGAAKAITNGWQSVWETQRFALGVTMTSEAEIEAALLRAQDGKLSSAASVIITFSKVVSHGFQDDWFNALDQLAAGEL